MRDRESPVLSGAPASRPLRERSEAELRSGLQRAFDQADGGAGAHCIHELWMRDVLAFDFDAALERLWESAARTIPEWLPMRYVDWLPAAYSVASAFRARARGRSNIYLVLLDYTDRSHGELGVYVGMTSHRPALRFDQHKAGIRAAGSVLRRGLELLTGPTLHLQRIARPEAERIEAELAVALRDAGVRVEGGH